MQKAIFLAFTIAAVALAGCTDEPPSGTFTATTPQADYSVIGVSVEAQAAQNEYPADNPEDEGQVCSADDIFDNDPTGMFPFYCEDAQSTVALTPSGGATLPLAGEPTGYSMFIIRDDGADFELGALDHHGEGHYDFPAQTYEGQDFSLAQEVQLRFGETVVATAPGNGGNFELAEGLQNISADVNFTGTEINVALTGVPENTPLVAWLVDIDEEGTKTHGVEFLLSSGETSYTLTEEEGLVADYEEFHIHVGASSINIAVAPIPQPAE